MKTRAREVIEIGDALFSKRTQLMNTWQDIAMNFYPERADFTSKRTLGSEFASHLMTGAPVLARRDLANAIGGMLRPRGQTWMHARTNDEKVNKDINARTWLDAATEHMRQYMYEDRSGFVRSMNESDNSWAAFGQSVVSYDLNRNMDGLLYRSWHLRDCAWTEDETRTVDSLHRKWTIQARTLVRLFPKTVDDEVRRCVDREPLREIECRHVVMPIDEWDGVDSPKTTRRKPDIKFISLYIDCDNETILEEVGTYALGYHVSRWQTIEGSQYAYSPATVIAIADARMLQQMSLTLLEAGQKAVSPPLIAVGEMIKGGINTFADGITYVDADYDEKTGDVLRPMQIDKSGLQWGNDREQKIREMIAEAFYLNKITMPEVGHGDMTAYETQKRIEEYIRSALPLFEPMEAENGKICSETFDLLYRNGAFGSPLDAPRALSGQQIRFVFESPLQAASSSKNAMAFQTTANLLSLAVQIDPMVVHDVAVSTGFRDAVEGTAPATWLVPIEEAEVAKAKAREEAAAQMAAMQQQQQIALAADVAQKGGDAVHKVSGAAQNVVGAAQTLAQPATQPGQ